MCPAKTTNFVFAIFYVLVHCITSVSSYALPIQSHIITAVKKFDVISLYTVSYTHLTLPTIYSV